MFKAASVASVGLRRIGIANESVNRAKTVCSGKCVAVLSVAVLSVAVLSVAVLSVAVVDRPTGLNIHSLLVITACHHCLSSLLVITASHHC